MTTNILRLAAVGAAALLLVGCASTQPASDSNDTGSGLQISPDAPPASIPAEGEVLGQGTVLQVDGEQVSLCLGAVMESYPPQCSGPEILGWDWASVDGAEAANGGTAGT